MKGIQDSPRQAVLDACVVLLLTVAVLTPLDRGDVISSVQFSIAFFATLLTGEAVIFALSFSPSSAWPSLREIGGHIAFREWVVTGWLAAMLAASGLFFRTGIPATYGALLFLLADAFGMFSFIRLPGLASAGRRKRLLRRALAGALGKVTTPAAGLRQRMGENTVLNAYLGQLGEAAARSDGNGVRDLAGGLATIPAATNGTAILAVHLDVIHRLAKAALAAELDPVAPSGAADVLLRSLLTRAATPGSPGPALPDAHRAACAMAQASRYLAWLASTSLTLSVQDVTPAAAARELVALSVRVRDDILRLADPDPPYAGGATDLGAPLTGAASVLAWIGGFCEFRGSHQAAGLYPVYEILTGTKFPGNYWDGDSVLAGLREALFAPGTADGAAAQAAKWAYLRTFASHRYLSTAGEALAALARALSHAGHPGGLWHQVRAAAAPLGWSVLVPAVDPHRRPSACVLAIGPAPWRDALAGPGDPHVTAVLAVQCGLAWLHPAAVSLRDDIDEALAALTMTRPDVRIDRLVLHNLPAAGDRPPDELAALNAAHAGWLYRLAVTGVLLPGTARPRVHRLITGGGWRSVNTADGIALQADGTRRGAGRTRDRHLPVRGPAVLPGAHPPQRRALGPGSRRRRRTARSSHRRAARLDRENCPPPSSPSTDPRCQPAARAADPKADTLPS